MRNILQPDGDWTPYLPAEESQLIGALDPKSCVVFAILNCLEILIKRQYGETVNFSDRFLASVAETWKGSTPEDVMGFLKDIGVVDESSWPFDETIDTLEKFYQKPSSGLYQLAKEFKKKWVVSCKKISNKDIDEEIKYSPIGLSVCAWHKNQGKYFRPHNMKDNHFTVLFSTKGGRFVFDTINVSVKQLADGVQHDIIRSFSIKKREPSWFSNLFK